MKTLKMHRESASRRSTRNAARGKQVRMQRCTVIVPEGLTPGDEFTVKANGQSFSVTVPDGVYGNVAIDLEIPTISSSSSTDRCVVTIPAGVGPGDTFNVEASWGGVFEITVPDGLSPGSELEVELPLAPTEQEAPYNIPLPPPPNANQGGVGWDDWTDGSSIRNGANNGRGHGDNAAAAGGADCSTAGVDTAATSAGTHAVGAKVQVQRTNGQWSPAVIKEYDEISDTYTVELLATLQLKYLVSENEIMPIDFEVERCGEHFVGRRVQVPCVGAESKDDVMGEVRSYDEATGLYTVAMDNGKLKRGLRSDEVRVRQGRQGPGTVMD